MKEYNAVVEVPSIESTLVPVFLGTIGDTPAYVCDARALHAFLEVGRDFSTWIQERIEEYGFVENQDFVIFPKNGEKSGRGRGRGRPTKDYHLSLDMAKELSMVERNDKGREARRYFIECERRALLAAGQVVPASHTETLIPSEQQLLHEIVKHKAHASVPAELIGKAIPEIWSRIHHKFHISKYEQLPRTQLTNAILYVNQMELRTGKKAIPKEEPTKALPFHVHYPMETAAPPVGYNGLSGAVFCESAWSDPGWELLMKLREVGFNVDGPLYSHYAKLHVIKIMRTTLAGKANDMLDALCTTLPYAPIYIR